MGLVGRNAVERIFLMWRVSNTFEEALTLQQLAMGRGADVESRLFSDLPQFAKGLEPDLGKPQVAEALWAIRLAYARANRQVPADIEALLASLPADAAPRCRETLRLLSSKPSPPDV
jgi:hypothetical protein